MKVIDVLNKIANGEEVPHFKVCEIEYFLNDRRCLREKEEDRPSEDTRWYIDEEWLNKEVEIIEEDKKIEKLTPFEAPFLKNEKPDIRFRLILDKINEIIDIVNKLKVDRK